MKRAMILVGATLSLAAAPRVDKVEPPNWWVQHTRNPIQILLTGSDLRNVKVQAPAGFSIEQRYASEDGRYLFVYVTIGQKAQVGSHTFGVKSPGGSTDFRFDLKPRLDPNAGVQGFTPDDVIYLLMPDRFANGDLSNDNPPEYEKPLDRSNSAAHHGGDFAGIRQKLPYLKDLGVTGIWVNPVYKNSYRGGGSASGYSTVDFYDAEPRFGGMQGLIELVDAAHELGMKVMQDQVANHSGPRHPWVDAPPTPTWFHDLRREPKLRNNFDIAGLADPYASPSRKNVPLNGWFAAILPDFNQDDPLASDYLIQNALWWIGMTGIDGIRQDTYPYVDRPFWELWQSAMNLQFPRLFVVGEITARTPAVLSFFDGGTRRYGYDTKLPSMLDFPLERAIRSVFGEGAPMTDLTGILAQDSLYRHPELLVTFMGNHDQPRFLTIAKQSISSLLMAQTFLLTSRGIPHLYYGDEVAMYEPVREERSMRADFPGGFPGDPVNAFRAEGRTGDAALVFDHLRSLLHFRRDHEALRRGSLMNLVTEKDRYVYLRSSPGEHVLVVLNRAGGSAPLLIDTSDLDVVEGTTFQPMGEGTAAIVRNGKLEISSPGDAVVYWAARVKQK